MEPNMWRESDLVERSQRYPTRAEKEVVHNRGYDAALWLRLCLCRSGGYMSSYSDLISSVALMSAPSAKYIAWHSLRGHSDDGKRYWFLFIFLYCGDSDLMGRKCALIWIFCTTLISMSQEYQGHHSMNYEMMNEVENNV